jgi:diaminopimelate epimerase
MDYSSYLIKIASPVEFNTDAYHTSAHVQFFKYHGCGNDFIMINNDDRSFDKHLGNVSLIRAMCDRHFGIGADGLIVISRHRNADFEMIYHNSDGKVSSVCGNGARCALAFAAYLGMYDSDKETTFHACDGIHRGVIVDKSRDLYKVSMSDIDHIQIYDEDNYFVDTGSPHHVTYVRDDLSTYNVKEKGSEIRNSAKYQTIGGANVNFVEMRDADSVKMRTFERGVEDESLACGTGAVAVAVVSKLRHLLKNYSTNTSNMWKVYTRGGQLDVTFNFTQTHSHLKGNVHIRNIYLIGPAKPVYHGNFTWKY